MMAYGAMNHCLLFGKWRKIWIFHEFYFYLFLPQKEELDFCYHDLLFYVNAIAYSVLKMSCFFLKIILEFWKILRLIVVVIITTHFGGEDKNVRQFMATLIGHLISQVVHKHTTLLFDFSF
jgi:hypothetical protein